MRTSRGIAARVALAYAGVSATWIVVSSYFAVKLPPPWEGVAEIIKGLMFVAFTAFLLYLMVGRLTKALEGESRAVADARRRLQQVVDTVPIGMLLLDGHNDVTFMNHAAESLIGVSAEQLVGSPLEALCGPEVQREFAGSIGEMLRTGSIDGLELPDPEGSLKPRAVIARAAEIDPKVPGSGWIVALADYSAAQQRRVRSDRLLEGYRFISEMAALIGRARDAEQLLRRACEIAVSTGGFKAAFANVESEDGFLEDAGTVGIHGKAADVVARMRGASKEGLDAMIRRFAETNVFVENQLADDPGSPWAEAAAESGFGSCVLFGIVDGGRLKAALTLFAEEPGFFDAEERRLVETLRNDIGVAFDRLALDQRRAEAEDALARSETDYRNLFECNPQPMWVRDWETMAFLAVNDAAVEKYGYSRAQFLSMTIVDIRPESEVHQLLEHMKRRTRGVADSGFWTHCDASGREFPVHVDTHAIDWDGRPCELVMVQEVAQMR